LPAALLLLSAPALADETLPQPTPLPPPIATPQDAPYPGTITLAVDATDLNRHIMKVHETVPVQKADDLVLLFPAWIPGDHGTSGPLPDLAGLIIKAGSQRVEWVRDTVNVHAFHVPVPPGTTTLDVSFQYLSAPESREGRVEMTPSIIDLQWNNVVLYPAGYFSRRITLAPSLTLPASWQFGTALETASTVGNVVSFKPTTPCSIRRFMPAAISAASIWTLVLPCRCIWMWSQTGPRIW
jgi:predicted metalloprotease with PDZ domain